MEFLKADHFNANIWICKKWEIKKDINYDYTFKDWKDSYLDISLREKTSILQISYKDNSKELIIPVLNKWQKYQEYSGKSKNRGINLPINI